MELIYTAAALKALRSIPPREAGALRSKIAAYAADPLGRHAWAKALNGEPGVRIRQGDWRAICEIRNETLTVTVVRAGHRREIYR